MRNKLLSVFSAAAVAAEYAFGDTVNFYEVR